MTFRIIRYSLREAMRSLIQNRLMTIAAVITVAACLFMVAISFSLAANLDYILQQMESYMSVTVYIQEDRSAEAVSALLTKVEAIPHVTSIEYISAQEALERFQSSLGDSSAILDGLEEDNPLPRSFILDVDNLVNQEYVVGRLNDMTEDGVDVVKHGGPTVNAFMTINNVLRVICLIIIASLGVISIVIIFNTIRIAVNARKTEINIMKYVGATDSFIRAPFLMEGMLIGITGAIIPCAVCYTIYKPLMDLLQENLPVINFDFRARSYIFSILLPLSLILGIIIGVAGSATSIRRHLNV
ncbi:MAG: permease-like cell division protein FtsX [Clostridiales bacterium]|jgi:cell division transport system permease protein|nr:permease-like cell division protein FtsX [Clostridiales bacterium]